MKTDGAGILAFKSNQQLDQEKVDANVSRETQFSRTADRLMQHCRGEWDRAREAKQPLEQIMLRSMRQRQGVYSANKLAAIQEMGGSEIKMMLTDVKCRAAIAWITDVILGTGERPFSCEPTPIPDMPPEIEAMLEQEAYSDLQQMQQILPDPADLRRRVEEFRDMVLAEATRRSKKVAKAMEVKIDDELTEGAFYEALEEAVDDFVTLPAAIVKGPVITARRELKWKVSLDPTRPNSVRAEVQKNYRRSYYCVSPWDVYMTPEAKTSEQGSLIEHHRLSPSDLYDLIGVPGYNETQIRGALNDFSDSGLKDWLWNDTERARLEKRPYENVLPDGSYIDTLEVWTKVRGKWLTDWGMQGIEDPDRWYDACCWMIGKYVIRATLNDDPLRKRPYNFGSYVPVRNSPYGRGVPELMDDLQNMCDGSARAISNNMGLASGPQAEVESDRLAAGEKVTKMQPWRIWQTVSSKVAGNSPAVRFFQPPIVVDALMKVFEFFSTLSDEYTGIPRYAYGDTNVGGAGETAAGLSMLMNASSRVMKGVIRNMDRIIVGIVIYTHRHIMLFDDEMPNKADVKIVARATQAIMHKEAQQLRLNETLMQTNNPIDFQIMGPKGRLEMLRASLRGMDSVDVEKVLPSNDDMLMRDFMTNMEITNQMNQKPGGEPTPKQPMATPGPGM